MYDVIVIGGGASGMMAAGRAAERGLRVLLLEKNRRLGEKLRISGGGRCNITNAEENERILLAQYGTAEKFLYSTFAQFGINDTTRFFESRGLPLKIEARKRAFPKTEQAEDVVRVLENYMQKGGVEVKLKSAVTNILHVNGEITGIECGNNTYIAQNYIVATGGVSHPETGSTGDGLNWLKKLCHSVKAPTPSIVPLKIVEQWVKDLAGVTLKAVRISFYNEGIKAYKLDGDILFTHFGISGPLILNNAWRVSDGLQSGMVTALIDMFPHTDLGTLESNIIKIFDANKNKSFKNIVGQCVPAGMQKGILTIVKSFIDPEIKVHSISRDQRKKLVHLLKSLPVTVEGLMGFERAVVADGGVPLQELDMRTMQSTKVPNLYITGDLLHINRPSGGFSLQLCWTTGYVAGSHVGT